MPRPGWGGEAVHRVDNAAAQPWHCAPFSEGATFGIELLYPFDTCCEVTMRDGRPAFAGDFASERRGSVVWPPFQSAHPGHYSMATLIDLKAPEGCCLRIEPHPSFFTDSSGQVPAAVIGNVHTAWWPLCLFVTFKSPREGETHRFEKGWPYCQVILVGVRSESALRAMDPGESAERELLSQAIMAKRARISTNRWVSHDRLRFDDTYKQLRRAYLAGGDQAVRELIAKVGGGRSG